MPTQPSRVTRGTLYRVFVPRLRPAVAMSARTPSRRPAVPPEKPYLTCHVFSSLVLQRPRQPRTDPPGSCRSGWRRRPPPLQPGHAAAHRCVGKRQNFLFPVQLMLSASSTSNVITSRLANKRLDGGLYLYGKTNGKFVFTYYFCREEGIVLRLCFLL